MFSLGALCFVIICSGIQLANGAIEPKILLPFFGNYQVNYTMHAEEGCYRWRSLREEVATISPIESSYNKADECSQSAIVVVKNTQPIRKTTLVLATNVKTGTIFQSDVIVDRIHMIDIVSRTRELYLADPPEELKIRALDQEGNTFSSTAGMEFEWTLVQDKASQDERDGELHHPLVSAHSILHIQKFLDTIYVADPYIDVIEKKGRMSDTILISGIQTGAAVVVANLVSTMECHKQVDSSSVRFIVRDKVILNPSHDIYLLHHAIIRYKVERWREGVPSEISMPSQQYVLNVRDLSSESQSGPVISLNQETSVVVGLQRGHSQVFLVDQHLKHYDDLLMEQATSDVYVVDPAYLRFDILPYHKWILQVGNIYEIIVHMFSEDNKRIWPADNIKIEGAVNNDYLEVLDTVENGTWYLVQAVKKGSCDISTLLKGVYNVGTKVVQASVFSSGSSNLEEFENPIFTSQNLEIFDKVVVSPRLVAFPWQPETVQYKYTFEASGGSGNYTWTVNETESSGISYKGEVSTQCGSAENQKPRSIAVKATDIRHSQHYGSAAVVLAVPAKLQFALSRLEAEVTTVLNLYVGMYYKDGRSFLPFTDCSQMKNLRWTIHDQSIFEFSSKELVVSQENGDPVPQTPSCLMRQVRALKEGHTTVSLSYQLKTLNETLQASTVIAAYNPLVVKDPVQLTVVALGSAKTMIFAGGPNPWPLLPNNHEKVFKADEKYAEFVPKISGKDHLFVATCISLGEVLATFTVQNKPCSTNPFPQKVEVKVKLSCAVPASLKVTTEYLPPSCPVYQRQSAQTVALAGDTIKMTLSAFDKFGNQFDNFTSLAQQWMFNSDQIALLSTESEFLQDEFLQAKHFFSNDLLVPVDLGGTSLFVIIDEYQEFVERSICSPYECKVSPAVKTSMLIDVISAVQLLPQSVVMFNRPNYSTSITISGGSGHFSHKIKTESGTRGNIVRMDAEGSASRSITLSPLSAGHAVLVVDDLCVPKATLIENAQARSSIVVSDLSSLFLEVSSPLEIGTSGKASIQLDIKQLSTPDSFNINIQLSSDPSDIISIDQAVKGEDVVFHADFLAQKIGTTTLRATTTSRDGKMISSNPAKVTVFPPLMLKPPRITVIRGSEFHLYVEGGPPEDAHIYFDVDDSSIASSSSSGVLTAHKLGNTTVRVRAVTKDGQVFHGRSSCQVYVVQIKGVLIDIPTHRFYTGSTVPVHVYGYAGPGFDPVNLDSDAAGLVFNWNVNNHAVLSLKSVHYDCGVQVSNNLKFTMLLNGKGAGQGSVSVAVSATDLSLDQLAEPLLEAEIQVTVFDPLTVQSDSKKLWSLTNNLLLTPETSYFLLSNRDNFAANIAYTALCESCSLNISTQDDDDSCITVNEDLKSITAGANPCQSSVLITAHEKFGVAQTMVIHVRVKMVSYLIAECDAKFHHRDPDSLLSGFPLGSKLSVRIHQFDNFGQRFDAASPEPKFHANRNDLIEVTPNPALCMLKAKAAKTGVSVFTLWSDKNIVYNFPMPVVITIKGEETNIVLPVGVKKCFRSDIVGPDNELGKWQVNKLRSVALDPQHGSLLPMSRSSGELVYSVDSSVESKLLISVEAFVARFEQNFIPKAITNVESRYVFPITISDSLHGTCSGLGKDLIAFAEKTFDCTGFLVNTLEAVELFKVSSTYISELRTYACVLDRIELSPDLMKTVSTFDDASFTINVNVRPEVSDRGISVQSPVNARFLPAFRVINGSHITMSESRTTLCISATLEIHNSIEITTNSRSFEIHPPGRYEDGIICRELSFSVSDEYVSKYEMKVSSSLTGQLEVLAVTIRLSRQFFAPMVSTGGRMCTELPTTGQPWSVDRYSLSYFTTIILIIITTLLFCASCGCWRWLFSPTPTRPNAIPAPGPRRSPPGMVPYSPSNSYLFPRSSPGQGGSPPSTSGSPSPRRPQLWSTYYQPLNASHTS